MRIDPAEVRKLVYEFWCTTQFNGIGCFLERSQIEYYIPALRIVGASRTVSILENYIDEEFPPSLAFFSKGKKHFKWPLNPSWKDYQEKMDAIDKDENLIALLEKFEESLNPEAEPAVPTFEPFHVSMDQEAATRCVRMLQAAGVRTNEQARSNADQMEFIVEVHRDDLEKAGDVFANELSPG